MGGMRAVEVADEPSSPPERAAVERTRRLRQLLLVGLVVLCVLNAGDLLTTRIILDHAGVLEANPVARALLTYYRVDVLKAGLLIALVWMAYRTSPTAGWACAVWFACGYYTLAVISNGLLIAALP